MNPGLVAFCLRSLYREYGAAFLLRVVLPHPVAALRGIARFANGRNAPERWTGGPERLVGLGFCLKPLSPPCPSGRPNHRCLFFETGVESAPCRDCLIRSLGLRALAAGSPVYIMTSARDVLHDLLLPALRRRRYRSSLLTLCRYSFDPMRLALSICGVEAALVPFLHGDCRDYAEWRRADVGDKPQQTVLDQASLEQLTRILAAAARPAPPRAFRQAGNIYEPRDLPASPAAAPPIEC